MRTYYLIIDGFWREDCTDYADMKQKAFMNRMCGRKVEEVISDGTTSKSD